MKMTKMLIMAAVFVAAMAVQALTVTNSAGDGYWSDSDYNGEGDAVSSVGGKNKHFIGDVGGVLRRSFYNFDLPATAGSEVASAKLRLYYLDPVADNSGVTLSIYHHTISSTTPAVSGFESTGWTDTGLGVVSDADDDDAGYVEFDVTTLVQASLDSGAGNVASFRLQIDGDTALSGTAVNMAFGGSANTDGNVPELIIEMPNVVIGSSEDGYLTDSDLNGAGDEVNNNDQNNHFVGSLSDERLRRSFLNFAVPGSFEVVDAKLRFYYYDMATDNSGISLAIYHNTVSSTDLSTNDFESTAWTDTGLGFTADADDDDSGWLEFDVTSFVQASEGNVASFRLQIVDDQSIATDARMIFRGAVTTDNDRYPELVIQKQDRYHQLIINLGDSSRALDDTAALGAGVNAEDYSVLPTPSTTNTAKLVYDLSGLNIGYGADSLEVSIVGSGNLSGTSGNGVVVVSDADAGDVWFDIGETLSFDFILRNGSGDDITDEVDFSLTGFSIKVRNSTDDGTNVTTTVAGHSLDYGYHGWAPAYALKTGFNVDIPDSSSAILATRSGQDDMVFFSQLQFIILPAALVLEGGAMNGSGHFDVEVRGLVPGTEYKLMKDTDLVSAPGFVEVDSFTAASGTETLTDTNAADEQAFYKVTD